jgi:hypothetical protein
MKIKHTLGMLAVMAILLLAYIHILNSTSPEFGPAERYMAEKYGAGWFALVADGEQRKDYRIEWVEQMAKHPEIYPLASSNLARLKDEL